VVLYTYGCDALGGVVDLDIAAEAASGRHVVVVVWGRGCAVLVGCEVMY